MTPTTLTEVRRAPAVARGSVLGDTLSSFKRWMLKAVRNPFVVVFGLVQPVIWLGLFPQVFQAAGRGFLPPGISYVQFFAPTVIIQAAIFASSGSGIGLVEDMRVGVFNKLLASPVHRGAMFMGKTLAETLRVAVQVVLILVFGLVLGASVATGFVGALAVIGVAIVFYLAFGALSNIVGLKTRSTEATIIISNFLVLPLLFLSPAFVPKDQLPNWLQVVATLNPVSYGIDAVRSLMLDTWSWEHVGKSVVILAAIDIVLVGLAAMLLRRATEAKAR